jgi:hypothetical protein
MSKKMTPEEVLNSVVEGINTGNLDSLMMLYETGACLPLNQDNLLKVQKLYAKAYVVSLT